jgi:hypothetical protein
VEEKDYKNLKYTQLLMKHHLTLLFLLFSLTAFGQIKLDGEFMETEFNEKLYITFTNDSLFGYYDGFDYGVGIFVIEDNILTLNFNYVDTTKNSFVTKETTCLKASDSVTIHFLILNGEEPIPYAHIAFFQNSKILKAAMTNIDGIVSLNALKQNQEIEIYVGYVGYKTFRYIFKPEKCMDFILNLTTTKYYTFPNGTKLKYRIKKYDGKKLVLREEKFSAPNIELKKTETNKRYNGNKID